MKKPKFKYNKKSISNIESLAKALSTNVKELNYLYQNNDNFYFLTKDIIKSDGSHRYVYDVKKRLKIIHDKIVKNILQKINYPHYLQGALKKRDFLSNAYKHTNKKIIISEDITNFFPSITKKIIYQIWACFFKFSHDVSEMLSRLVTFRENVVQGCKTSSYLANLVLWLREEKLVNEFNSKGYTYTRYVDDIYISSSCIITNKDKHYIISKVYRLFSSINVKPNRKKQRIMPGSGSQTVHRVNVNRNKPSFSKKVRNKIRSAVFHCKKNFENGMDKKQYNSIYNSVRGKVNMLKRLHNSEANSLLLIMNSIKPN